MQHKEQLGFLTFAINSADVDYLSMAYLQALNIKETQKNNRYAVVVDSKTYSHITEKQKKVFDYIIKIDKEFKHPYELEPQAFALTPFKETIKLEADLLLPVSIDHWIDAFRLRDVVLSYGCKDYFQKTSTTRKYRRLFDENNLPDTYNGLMYFRYSQHASNFFRAAEVIFNNWDIVKNNLKNCRDDQATTDVVYAIAALLVGPEQCYIPTAEFINFVHMKPSVNGFSESLNLTDVFLVEWKDGLRINNINQYHPLHYHDKKFPIEQLTQYYESRILG